MRAGRLLAYDATALGTFGDPSVLPVLQTLASSDPDTFVRDQAQIAMQRL